MNALLYKLTPQTLKVHNIHQLTHKGSKYYPDVHINLFPKHNAFKVESYLKQLTSDLS